MKNILEFLEANALKYPDKKAFISVNKSLTYGELQNEAKAIGSALIKKLKAEKKPVAVYFDKEVTTISAMLGVVYSGNFYTVIDSEMPKERIEKIFSTLSPAAVITDEKYFDKACELSFDGEVLKIGELVKTEVDEAALSDIRERQIDTDLVYALYTSGSTGIPKGAVLSHKSVISYTNWVTNEFKFDSKTVFANQTPFYFSMSVTDIYSTLKSGATLCIIPKIYFSFPIKLIEFLNEYKVNTIYWVPSAISIISNFDVFKYGKPEHLKTVLFAGEVMHTKQLNYWIDNLEKDVTYANLFGPTETTDICTFYVVDRVFRNDESLPIGKHCDNCNVFILKDDGSLAGVDEEGELYARGSFLSSGYYNNPEKTAEAFVQNPLNKAYPETVYKTGDIVKYNDKGEIIYITRKDFQIKHMGYRIELGEIETAVNSMEEIKECACVYSEKDDKIVLFYNAKKTDEKVIMSFLSGRLPDYLLPNRLINMKQIPHNQNGKIDRKQLKTLI